MHARGPCLLACLLAWLLIGCGSSTSPPDGTGGTGAVCPSGLELDGACVEVGVPPDGCAAGFVWADGGCSAELPETACPAGQLALPGEVVCRPVRPCEGWADLPLDGTTQYVDGSYGGGGSNGSSASPWQTIQEAVDAAAPGAIVAVAPGSYPEAIVIASKPVRLWGTCPDEVTVVGPPEAFAAIFIHSGANQTEIGGLAITGASRGIAITASLEVAIHQVRVHDTADRALDVEDAQGSAAVVVTDSLVEHAVQLGFFVSGDCTMELHRTAVRDVVVDATGLGGDAVFLGPSPDGPGRPTMIISASLFERNQQTSIYNSSGHLTMDATLVRDTFPAPAGEFGRGVQVATHATAMTRAFGLLRQIVVEGGHDEGVFCGGADLTIEQSTVRDVAPNVLDHGFGRGISAQEEPTTLERPNLQVDRSLVERVHEVGIAVDGGDGTFEHLWVRDVFANGARGARGINVQSSAETEQAGNLTVRRSVVAGSVDTGLVGFDAAIIADGVRIDQSAAATDEHRVGDGVDVVLGTASLQRLFIHDSPRAGLAVFSAVAEIGQSLLECNAIQLDGEVINGIEFVLDDRGGNQCGCGEVSEPCKTLSSALTPPEPVN